MTRVVALAGVPLLLAAALGMELGHAAPAASRIIDRTVLCEAAIGGGVRKIDLHFSSAARGGGSAYVEARTSATPTWRLVGLSREVDGKGSMELSPDCRRSRARVPLNSRGLAGGLVSNTGDAHDCWTPRWLVIRARTVFRSRTALRPSRPWGFPTLFARGNVKEAYLAIQTRTGKPIAFAALTQSGRARVFMSDNCFPD